MFSTPDKIFRYFATIKIGNNLDGGILMTPYDFTTSLSPGLMQPKGRAMFEAFAVDI
jgi:calcium uptake protein 1, mitochondrial